MSDMAHNQSLARRLSTEPPAVQDSLATNPTLIVSWFCTIYSLFIITVRVLGRWVRTEKLFREDKIMLWSIIPLLVRMGLVHVILLWGTNSTQTFALGAGNIHRRSIGSRLVLASRIFYAVFIWMAKLTVLEFLQRIIGQSWTKMYERGARLVYGLFAVTLVAVVVATLAECQPFSHYWQVVPDPGPRCRTGSAQLLTMGICDIVTDLVIIAFPIPIVVMSKMRTSRKISLVVLFLLSLILVAITIYRMPAVINRHFSQQFRSLLASLEILAATAVANTIAIGSFLRDRGVKKTKFRAASFSGSNSVISRVNTRQSHPSSAAMRYWGSDEDLVRDLGMTLQPSLRHSSAAQGPPRLAPMADPTPQQGSDERKQRRRGSSESGSGNSSEDTTPTISDPSAHDKGRRDRQCVREISEGRADDLDVGGSINQLSSRRSTTQSSQNASLSRSQANFLSDVGGLISSSDTASSSSNPAPHLPRDLSIARRSPAREARQSRMTNASHSQPVLLHVVHDDIDSLSFSDAGGLLGK